LLLLLLFPDASKPLSDGSITASIELEEEKEVVEEEEDEEDEQMLLSMPS
jgi:hypothetical protein